MKAMKKLSISSVPLIAMLAFLGWIPLAEAAATPTRPNIVFVLIDDMGWADLSCFGNTEAQTPHIDQMAAEGLAFEQFYVNSPICSPSRVAISTGQYPQRWSITSFLAKRAANNKRGMAQWLDPQAPMLARSLKQVGYATGHFGKWHMGGQRDVETAPPITAYGFDKSLTNFEGMGPKLLPLTMEPGAEQPGRIWEDAERLGGPVTWMQRSTITGGYVDAALDFIRTAETNKTPFYVNVWPDDVHSPYWPPVEQWREGKRGLYLAVLEEMDRQLAPLFDHVRNSPALRNNTLVLICSDNGFEQGGGQAGELKGCKGTLFEGGMRSPLIVWGPGMLKPEAAGTRNRSSVFSAIDFAPSLVKLAGAKPPAGAKYDGEDVLDTMLGKSNASRQAPIFYGRPPDRKNVDSYKDLPDLAVRFGKWKVLCDFDGARPLLYDIPADPGETTNLAAAHPETVKDLTKKVVDWYRSMPTR